MHETITARRESCVPFFVLRGMYFSYAFSSTNFSLNSRMSYSRETCGSSSSNGLDTWRWSSPSHAGERWWVWVMGSQVGDGWVGKGEGGCSLQRNDNAGAPSPTTSPIQRRRPPPSHPNAPPCPSSADASAGGGIGLATSPNPPREPAMGSSSGDSSCTPALTSMAGVVRVCGAGARDGRPRRDLIEELLCFGFATGVTTPQQPVVCSARTNRGARKQFRRMGCKRCIAVFFCSKVTASPRRSATLSRFQGGSQRRAAPAAPPDTIAALKSHPLSRRGPLEMPQRGVHRRGAPRQVAQQHRLANKPAAVKTAAIGVQVHRGGLRAPRRGWCARPGGRH